MDTTTSSPAPVDPREWRPMRPYRGRKRFEITDPIVEPLWSGVRVIAHVETRSSDEPRVTIIEDLGSDVAPELPDVAAALGRSVMATSAIIDGVITTEVGLEGVGAAAIPEVRASTTSILMRNNADLDVVRRRPSEKGSSRSGDDEAETAEGFVALDLLEIDGTTLLDVPLLERKRILESAIAQTDLIRISIHARPPYEMWVTSWKALGLRGAMLKAANSRYQPGGDTIEWRPVESINRRG